VQVAPEAPPHAVQPLKCNYHFDTLAADNAYVHYGFDRVYVPK
jgi:hypothetical protein